MCVGNDLPVRFLPQLLLRLKRTGAVDGRAGLNGGYRLGKPAHKITLLEIIEAIDGSIGDTAISDFSLAPKALAEVSNAFAAVAADARKRLAKVTLADLQAVKAA